MQFDKKKYEELFDELISDCSIVYSNQTFKINLFMQKAKNSLLIAKHLKEFSPSIHDAKKGYFDSWAIVISYYSMLYSAKAAILSKGYEVKTHDAAQIALGNLLVPSSLEKEDLEILDMSYKIFEDQYVKYFEDAKKESHTARYSTIQSYTSKRLTEIFENASRFIGKIELFMIKK
jgi:uncharacterized protein (UPF0332 family)